MERGNSAWVADANWSVNDRWTIGGSYQWDPKFRREDLASLRTRYLIGDEGVVNLCYRYRRNLLKQADLSFLYPLSRRGAWSAATTTRCTAIRPAAGIPSCWKASLGVQWDSCCLASAWSGAATSAAATC